MAHRTITIAMDDMDGSEGASTHTLALDGTTYELELGDKNFAKLEKALEPFFAVARKQGRAPRGRKTTGGPTPSQIREWAEANGHEVSPRGRIAAPIREAYDAAH